MNTKSYQKGYVSEPIRTRRGTAFKIRYRIRTTEGKWRQRAETLYGLSGKKAAWGVLQQRLHDSSMLKPEASNLTLRDFVVAYWKPYLERKNTKPSTRLSYESNLECHVEPVLGTLRLADISPLHVEDFVRAKLDTGLSPKTVRNLVGLLQGIFSLAVENDLISRSPVRGKHKPSVRSAEKPVWTGEQVRSIIQSVPKRYCALLACAALTGARLGEVLAVQWKHVDLEKQLLRIEQSLWNGQLLPPKTQGSIRTVPFGSALAEALKVHLRDSLRTGTEDFVFCKPDGSPLNPDVLRRDVLYPALDRLGIPRSSRNAGFHTFRHSAASFINNETGNLKLAQRLLGHSNLNTTADVYTHTSAETEREGALAVERAIYGEMFPVVPKIETGNSAARVN